MFKYFSIKDNLSEVLLYFNTSYPKIILCEYGCLVDNRMYIRDFNEEDLLIFFKEYLKSEFLLEFIIFDNKKEQEKITDGLTNVGMYEPLIEQEPVLNSFYENYKSFISRNRSIWKINLNDSKKNELINILAKSYEETNIKICVIFSTLIDAVNFSLVYDISPNMEIVVFDTNMRYTSLKDSILELMSKKLDN